MTLLARRREELSRGPEEAAALEERRSVVVRPHPIQRSFLHLQEAIGNGGAARLLGSLAGSGAHAARAHRAPPARVLVAQHLRPAIGRAWEDRRQRPRLIVPDGAEPGPGQIARAAFISTIAEAARQAAEEGLVEIGQTARDCPLIEHYTRLYTQRSAARLEADVLRYVPAARLARSAEDYIAAASAHVRASVLEWIRTGDLVGLPRGLPGSELAAAIHRTGTSNPAAVRTRLGEGRPLGGAARSRMERAFRTNLGEVRIHTDEAAAREAHAQNARAFAVGSHIAFGRDEYRPGSIVGDALLAHEVAHTLQQRGVDSPAAQSRTGSQRLERDAHVAAGGALASLWAGATALGSAMARMAFPRLRSGLALARCAGERFTDEELKTYLDHIREHGPEGKLSSDNKARAVVREFRGGSGKFPLDDWLVLNLIKEMLGGAVLADDEAQIFELLRRSENDRLEYLFTKDRLTPKMVLQDIGGQSEADIKKFFELRFVGGMEAVEGDEVEARGKPYPDLERLADRQLESIRAEAKRKKVERLEEERKRRERERRKKEKEGDEESVTDDPPLPSSADVKVDTGDMVDALALKAKKEEKKKEPIDKWLEEEEKDGGVSYLAFATETIERVENAAKKSKKFEEIAEMMELAPPKFDASIASNRKSSMFCHADLSIRNQPMRKERNLLSLTHCTHRWRQVGRHRRARIEVACFDHLAEVAHLTRSGMKRPILPCDEARCMFNG